MKKGDEFVLISPQTGGQALEKLARLSLSKNRHFQNEKMAIFCILITDKKLAPRSVNQYSSAIRFFFAVGLNRYMNYNQIPMMKIPKNLPELLSRDEVHARIDSCINKKHRALMLLAYGSGLRSSEIVSLRVKDIDSKEMRVLVKGGKSNRDHYTLLSQTTLDALRDYWREFRPNSPDGCAE